MNTNQFTFTQRKKKGEFESKAEFIISNGKIIEIRICETKGHKPLKGKDLKNFKDFLSGNGLIILCIAKTLILND